VQASATPAETSIAWEAETVADALLILFFTLGSAVP
jgi:hypothetical protein